MDGDLVVRVIIQAFDDIDLSAGRPIGTLRAQSGGDNTNVLEMKRTIAPECWPSPTPCGHVYGIQDNEAASIGELAGDADALSVPRDGRCRLHSHDSIPGGVDLD